MMMEFGKARSERTISRQTKESIHILLPLLRSLSLLTKSKKPRKNLEQEELQDLPRELVVAAAPQLASTIKKTYLTL